MAGTGRSTADLQSAAMYVGFEWTSLAEMSAELAKITGARTIPAEHALMEACFLHLRCLIDFCCGTVEGRRHRNDIQPMNFLGVDWWPPDPLDRRLRGRLPVINKHLAHLSWERVTDTTPIMWPMASLAHEVTSAMKLFVRELRTKQGVCLGQFEAAERRALASLPSLHGPETLGPLGPVR